MSTRTPVRDFDPFAPQIMADPYPAQAELLRTGRPLYLERRDMWIVTRYEDVGAAIKDHRGFSSADGIAYDRSKLPIIFGVDPPDHTRLRRLINRDFTPRTVESWRPLVERISDELVSDAVASGDVELVSRALVPLPVRVISAILGIPGDDAARFKLWSEGVIEGFNANARLRPRAVESDQSDQSGQSGLSDKSGQLGELAESAESAHRRRAAKKAMSAVANISAYFHDLLERRRREPAGDDLISKLLAANEDDLRDDELVWLCLALLVGGNETTTHLLGNACIALMEYPDQHRLVRDRPELIPAAVEETLRFDPPLQSVFRTTTTDVEIGGVRIPADSRVQLSLAAANRDPRRWPEPDRFRVERAAEGHLAFGGGIHYCIGGPLARIEAATFLRRLFERTEGMALTGTLDRIKSPTFRGVAVLPLRLTPKV